jgi:hypothetical protein
MIDPKKCRKIHLYPILHRDAIVAAYGINRCSVGIGRF